MNKRSLNKAISQKIKIQRKRTDYSQQSIAHMLGLSRASYVNIEAGRQALTPINIYTLCRIFKCRITDLFPKIKPVKIESSTRRFKVIKTRTRFKKIK